MDEENRSKSFVFLGGQYILKGIFDSHNIRFLENLYKYEVINYNHVIFSYICEKNLRLEDQKILERKKKILLKIAEKYGFQIEFYQIDKRSFKNILAAVREITKILKSNSKTPFVWCHNIFNGLIGYLLSRNFLDSYYHLELKGVVPEEELLYGESSFFVRFFKYLLLEFFCRFELLKAKSLSVVSNRFKDYIVKKYHFGKKIYVYPSVYDKSVFKYNSQKRKKMRGHNHIKSSDIVISYLGSMISWQLPEKIFEFFANIEKQDKKGKVKRYIFTHDVAIAKQLKRKYKIKSLVIKTLSGSEVAEYLLMSDIGVICRRDDIVNNVASPTKIAEYISTHNSIILTESVGDYGLDLKGENFAIVCDTVEKIVSIKLKDIEKLEKPSQEYLNKFNKEYSIERIIEYKKLFK